MVAMSLCNHLPRLIYLHLLLCLATWGSWAQKRMVYLMVDNVDQSTLLCYYQYKHNESGHPETINMLLQIGGKVQKFGSLAQYYEDSLALPFRISLRTLGLSCVRYPRYEQMPDAKDACLGSCIAIILQAK